MVSAVGTSTYSGYPAQPGGAPSVAALEARLARYEKELSECVNCDTADTREGKQAIQELTIRISETRTRIEEVAAGKSGAPAGIPVGAVADFGSANGVPAYAGGPLGGRLDVFA